MRVATCALAALLASSGADAADWQRAAMRLSHQDAVIWIVGTAALTLGAFLGCLWQLRRARLHENTPTSRIRSAAQGYVELEGVAGTLPGPEIVSPLTRTPCVWWSVTIERLHRDADDSPGHRGPVAVMDPGWGWPGAVAEQTLRRASPRIVRREQSNELFVIRDQTGECVVDVAGAAVRPSVSRSWRGTSMIPDYGPAAGIWFPLGGRYRYTEKMIRIGDPLYVLGWFRTHSEQQEFDRNAELRALLADWKKDRAELLRRFDANGDGEIDPGEWEQVRKAAKAEVARLQVERSTAPDVNIIAAPRDRRPFIVSTVPQARLVFRARLAAAALLALAACSAAALSFVVHARTAAAESWQAG